MLGMLKNCSRFENIFKTFIRHVMTTTRRAGQHRWFVRKHVKILFSYFGISRSWWIQMMWKCQFLSINFHLTFSFSFHYAAHLNNFYFIKSYFFRKGKTRKSCFPFSRANRKLPINISDQHKCEKSNKRKICIKFIRHVWTLFPHAHFISNEFEDHYLKNEDLESGYGFISALKTKFYYKNIKHMLVVYKQIFYFCWTNLIELSKRTFVSR